MLCKYDNMFFKLSLTMTLVYDLKIQQIRPYYINDNIFCRAKLCCYSYYDSIFLSIFILWIECFIVANYSIMHDITLCYIVF